MAQELDNIAKKLAARGYQIASESVNSLKEKLQEDGLIPDFLPAKPLPENKIRTLDLAQKVNNAFGADVDDETSIISLVSFYSPDRRRELGIEPRPRAWVELLEELTPAERGVVNKVINNFSRNGLTVGDLRNAETFEMNLTYNMRKTGKTTVEFVQAMFKKREE